eukprot:Opistho-2@74753
MPVLRKGAVVKLAVVALFLFALHLAFTTQVKTTAGDKSHGQDGHNHAHAHPPAPHAGGNAVAARAGDAAVLKPLDEELAVEEAEEEPVEVPGGGAGDNTQDDVDGSQSGGVADEQQNLDEEGVTAEDSAEDGGAAAEGETAGVTESDARDATDSAADGAAAAVANGGNVDPNVPADSEIGNGGREDGTESAAEGDGGAAAEGPVGGEYAEVGSKDAPVEKSEHSETDDHAHDTHADDGSDGARDDTAPVMPNVPASDDGHAGHKHEEETENVGQQLPRGSVNRHVYGDVCGNTVDAGRKNVKFPKSPDRRDLVQSLESKLGFDNYFCRLFGFIHPPASGAYRFAISCDDHCELWVSKSASPKDEEKLAFVGTTAESRGEEWSQENDWSKYPSQQSVEVIMEAGKRYYVEVLHKQLGGGEHVEVAWKQPGSSGFEIIAGNNLSPYVDESGLAQGAVVADDDGHGHSPDDLPPSHSHRTGDQSGGQISAPPADERDHFHLVPLLDDAETSNILPECEYAPSYIMHRPLRRYEGVNLVRESEVYPDDHTSLKDGNNIHPGNRPVHQSAAEDVVNKFMAALNAKRVAADKFSLEKIVNVERKNDPGKGERFLVELDLTRPSEATKKIRVSEYVYRPQGQDALCSPRNFKWDKHAMVHVIVPVKNQGVWLQHFIDDMSAIYGNTKDPHFNVIVVDFGSTDIDVDAAFARSGLKQYKVIHRTGNFERAGGIQAGIDFVTNPNDIIFTCDLHLEIPDSLIEGCRKHTIKGIQAYAPLVVRLACGFTPETPSGFWESAGYGLFALYKSDFDRIGGMNTREFRDRWGGEDWECVDRVLGNGLEIERLRLPKFYHYYHSRKGMWGSKA